MNKLSIFILIFMIFLAFISMLLSWSLWPLFPIVYLCVAIGQLSKGDECDCFSETFYLNGSNLLLDDVKYVTIICSPFSVFIKGLFIVDCKIKIYMNNGLIFETEIHNFFQIKKIRDFFNGKVKEYKLPFSFTFFLFNILFWVCFIGPMFKKVY